MFLIHYGWRGTRPDALRECRDILVSNPLRLEGDVIEVVYDDRFQVFLIHYGWRGTRNFRPMIRAGKCF